MDRGKSRFDARSVASNHYAVSWQQLTKKQGWRFAQRRLPYAESGVARWTSRWPDGVGDAAMCVKMMMGFEGVRRELR